MFWNGWLGDAEGTRQKRVDARRNLDALLLGVAGLRPLELQNYPSDHNGTDVEGQMRYL